MSDSVTIRRDGPASAAIHILLAHGAGAGADHPFMAAMATGLGDKGYHVIRFNFPYMDRALRESKKRPPDRQPVLESCFDDMMAMVPTDKKLVLAGKSMGGRMASLVAARRCQDATARRPDAWIALGYPFHAPGKPEKLRMDHFPDITCPGLICQGERDPFGTEAEIRALDTGDIKTVFLPDGEHSFKPRKSSGVTEDENFAAAITAMDEFLARLG